MCLSFKSLQLFLAHFIFFFFHVWSYSPLICFSSTPPPLSLFLSSSCSLFRYLICFFGWIYCVTARSIHGCPSYGFLGHHALRIDPQPSLWSSRPHLRSFLGMHSMMSRLKKRMHECMHDKRLRDQDPSNLITRPLMLLDSFHHVLRCNSYWQSNCKNTLADVCVCVADEWICESSCRAAR